VLINRSDSAAPMTLMFANAGLTGTGYGELWLDTDEDEVELARLIVPPDRRHQGLGGGWLSVWSRPRDGARPG
jgi:hypothetical protein